VSGTSAPLRTPRQGIGSQSSIGKSDAAGRRRVPTSRSHAAKQLSVAERQSRLTEATEQFVRGEIGLAQYEDAMRLYTPRYYRVLINDARARIENETRRRAAESKRARVRRVLGELLKRRISASAQ
jgi:hypothetical protein